MALAESGGIEGFRLRPGAAPGDRAPGLRRPSHRAADPLDHHVPALSLARLRDASPLGVQALLSPVPLLRTDHAGSGEPAARRRHLGDTAATPRASPGGPAAAHAAGLFG